MPAAQARAMSAKSARPVEPALREFVRVVGLLERVMQPYFARFGISGSQWGLLRTLYRAEQDGQQQLRLMDLSEKLLVRPPSVSGAVDRMERAGLVMRGQALADQRAKHVGLTAKGRQLVQRVLAVHEKQIGTVLAGLTTQEQTEFHRLLTRLGRHLEGLLTENYGASLG